MNLTTLIVVGLATWQIIEIWHHSTLFAGWRDWVSTWDQGIRGWLGELLGCPFCTSPWVAWATLALLWTPPVRGFPLGEVFVWGLAASRLANCCNDLFHAYCRTPRQSLEDLVGPPEDDAET